MGSLIGNRAGTRSCPQCQHNPAHTPGVQESRYPACQVSLATTWLSNSIVCAAECNTVIIAWTLYLCRWLCVRVFCVLCDLMFLLCSSLCRPAQFVFGPISESGFMCRSTRSRLLGFWRRFLSTKRFRIKRCLIQSLETCWLAEKHQRMPPSPSHQRSPCWPAGKSSPDDSRLVHTACCILHIPHTLKRRNQCQFPTITWRTLCGGIEG